MTTLASIGASLIQELAARWWKSFVDLSPWALWMALTVAGALVLWMGRPNPASTERHASSLSRVIWAAPIAAGAVIWAYQLRWVGDDAFISFRYARNLVEGHGLVFNPGERVEGYTNFLWTLLMAGAIALGQSPILASVALSLASLAGVILGVAWLSNELAPVSPRAPISLAALVCGCSYLMANFGTSGLETMFAAFLVVAMVVVGMRGRWTLSGCLGIAAALSHPDHLIYYGAMGLALATDPSVLRSPKLLWTDRKRRRDVLGFWAPLLLAFVPYFVWRTAYYGEWYPNTYYAKSGNLSYFSQGSRYLVITLFAASAFVAAPLAITGAVRRWKLPAGRFYLIALFSFCLYAMKIGGDFMLGRILITLLPLTFLFAEVGLRELCHEPTRLTRWISAVALAGFFLAAIPVRIIADGEKFAWVSDERSFYPLGELSERGVSRQYRTRARDLRNHVLDRGLDPLLGAGNVGIVGYLSGIRITDLLALTDREVARMPIRTRSRPGHEKVARGAFLIHRAADLSDDPIFPPPYSRLSRATIGSSTFFLTGYSPELLGPLSGDARVKVPNLRAELRKFSREQHGGPRVDRHRNQCDAWFFDTYFFRHNDAPRLEKSFLAQLSRRQPELGDAVELLLPSRPSGRFRSERVFDFSSPEDLAEQSGEIVSAPTTGLVPDQGFVHGQDGPFLNTYHPELGDRARGQILTRPFELRGDALSVDVGGGMAGVAVELVVDGRVVRNAVGCNAEMLGRKVWSLEGLQGKTARLRIADRTRAGWGHILADTVQLWHRT